MARRGGGRTAAQKAASKRNLVRARAQRSRAGNRVARTHSTSHGLTAVHKGVFVTSQSGGFNKATGMHTYRAMTGTATKKGWGYSGPITAYKRGGKLHIKSSLVRKGLT